MTSPAPLPAGDRLLTGPDLLERLVAAGWLAAAEARVALTRLNPRDARHPLLQIADLGLPDAREPARKLQAETLSQWLAQLAELPYVRIDPLSIDVARVTTAVPYAYAARAKILPLRLTAGELVVATAQPWQRDWERDLAPALKQKIQRVVANPADIERYLVEFYALARSVRQAQSDRAQVGFGGVQNLEQLLEMGRNGRLTADDQHVVAIVDWLLSYAFESRASDIHFEPRRETANLRFRIDGVLHEVYQMPASVGAAVTSRLKILARMDVAEKRRPQDGRIKTRSPAGKEVELRASSLPTAFGEKLVLRIFDPEVLVKDFAALGFTPADRQRWETLIRQPTGILLVTGPTGSGKTTTLYSSLRQLATPEINVCTIEDPIELVEPAFNQMQVQPAIDLDFAAGLRALLRQDPDIIMVGEIRDLETAENAVQAALTGHLVLSTLHTNDAPSAITRLLDLGVAPYLIKATLLGVLAQRLVRKLCPHCRRPAAPDPAEWAEIAGPLPLPAQVHGPAGCLECRETGYLGRVGLYEILPLSPALKARIDRGGEISELRRQALRDGLVPLRQAGARAVAEGLTSIDEVLRNAPSADPDAA
ncbi:MAG TPA: GspE/PulE family protein [Nevskiaceae bacterium]|nr:GspE/PulE family protein [Nevskiaceae bacterium]